MPTQAVADLSLNNDLPPRHADSGIRARVLFEYTADEENEMTLVEGEIVEQIEMIDEGWWSAVGEGGKSGLFPCEFAFLFASLL